MRLSLIRGFVDAGADERSQAMSVETRRRRPHAARPIVVQISEFISEALDIIRGEMRSVLENHVMRRSHGALVHELRHEEEIGTDASLGDGRVDDGARRRIRGGNWKTRGRGR